MAILDGREIWRCHQNDQWEPLSKLDGLRANCILSTDSDTLVGTSEAHIYCLKRDGLSRLDSFDKAQGKDTWFTPWGGPPDVRSLSSDASGTVFANVHVGGVLKSTDGNTDWRATIEVESDVHQIITDPDSRTLLAASANGLAISRNDGKTWQYRTSGLHGKYLRAVAVSNSTTFVTASTGHDSNHAMVYRGDLNSDTPFIKCKNGLPEFFTSNIDSHCLAANLSMVAFGTHEGDVFVSNDCGKTWALVAENLPSIQCIEIK